MSVIKAKHTQPSETAGSPFGAKVEYSATFVGLSAAFASRTDSIGDSKSNINRGYNLKMDSVITQRKEQWNPYVDNGGTILAASFENSAIVVGDSRTSFGFSIATRNFPKFTKLTDKAVIITSGQQSEIVTLHRILKVNIASYQFKHRKIPSLNAIHRMVVVILYQKRFFPFYAFNILAGIDGEGKGAIYSYDAIGSAEKLKYTTAGSGGAFALPILDAQLEQYHRANKQKPTTRAEVIDIMKDCIASVAERDIYTGDNADIIIIDASGVSISSMPLRND
ncbi:putative proteasome subunit beta type 1 [Cardiosporidium cionae]|uniref:Proteasome subunit beta type 1 n=1 Tax=Cardiosporidium cionae TaxID=476202 RepID=A0ABQ7JAX2_9APIC|nr:putative proteasome subunit beta type 1 [Cardiosporidium cionae]|eukprot:KAF8821069.1 putative proteasome subunit beta type 1 [Cardiosporidium cionae]